jgi:predicted nucleic acid-binding protein
MIESRFVLDTNAVIFLTTRGNTITSGLYNELNEADLFISAITEIELFAKPAMPPDEEEKLRAFISDRISVVDLTSAVKKEAIALRRTVNIKLPDCIVAATAIALSAVLLTADRELLRVKWPGYSVMDLGI